MSGLEQQHAKQRGHFLRWVLQKKF